VSATQLRLWAWALALAVLGLCYLEIRARGGFTALSHQDWQLLLAITGCEIWSVTLFIMAERRP
jgi:hypothetical protein